MAYFVQHLHTVTQADVAVMVCGATAYFLCLCTYLYVWKTRYFPPLRAKKPGITVLANCAALLWFLSVMVPDRLIGLWHPQHPFLRCWSLALLGRMVGQSLFVMSLLAKQYRAFQHYAVGKATWSTSTHVLLGQLPLAVVVGVLLGAPRGDGCFGYDVAEFLAWGYEGVLAGVSAVLVVHLRPGTTYYEYPNYGDSCLECVGLLLQTFLHGFVLLCPGLPDDAKRLLLVFGNTVIIPVGVFLGVVLKPLWKYAKSDLEFMRDFDRRFGSRVTSLAGAYCGVGYRGSRLREGSHPDAKPTSGSASFEVEELSRLVMAGELRMVKQLLYNATLGIVNEKDSEGSTPLHRAVRNMHREMIEFLLDMGADPDAMEADGVTPLHVAASLGNVECIYLLAGLNKANVNVMTATHGKTPLDIAVKSECMATIVMLLNLGADPNQCVPFDDKEPLTDLRAYVRKVGHYSKYKSPAFLAVELGLDPLLNCMHCVHLPRGGVAVDRPGPEGMGLLGVAALLGHSRVVESLLTMKADVFQVNPRYRRSALHYVCMKGSLRTFQALLKGFAMRVLQDASGAPSAAGGGAAGGGGGGRGDSVEASSAPVGAAGEASFDDSVGPPDLRLSCGSDSNSQGSAGSDATPGSSPTPAFHDVLNLRDVYGRTALHYAVLKGSAQITYMLLCLGAIPTLEDGPAAKPTSTPRSGGAPALPPSAPLPASLDCPVLGWAPVRYATELARQHDPYQKVSAVFPEAARLLERKPATYPRQYLHDDSKWLPLPPGA